MSSAVAIEMHSCLLIDLIEIYIKLALFSGISERKKRGNMSGAVNYYCSSWCKFRQIVETLN